MFTGLVFMVRPKFNYKQAQLFKRANRSKQGLLRPKLETEILPLLLHSIRQGNSQAWPLQMETVEFQGKGHRYRGPIIAAINTINPRDRKNLFCSSHCVCYSDIVYNLIHLLGPSSVPMTLLLFPNLRGRSIAPQQTYTHFCQVAPCCLCFSPFWTWLLMEKRILANMSLIMMCIKWRACSPRKVQHFLNSKIKIQTKAMIVIIDGAILKKSNHLCLEDSQMGVPLTGGSNMPSTAKTLNT